MYSIKETIEKKINGLFYGNRLLLPFKANYLKIILDDEIIHDFSPQAGKVYINETENFTDFYFLEHPNLPKKVTEYEAVKMLVTEKDADIFNKQNHIKISLYLDDPHTLRIEETGKDVLFIE
jgi:hypothetical protein